MAKILTKKRFLPKSKLVVKSIENPISVYQKIKESFSTTIGLGEKKLKKASTPVKKRVVKLCASFVPPLIIGFQTKSRSINLVFGKIGKSKSPPVIRWLGINHKSGIKPRKKIATISNVSVFTFFIFIEPVSKSFLCHSREGGNPRFQVGLISGYPYQG